jgi:hypothetical protein
MNTAVFIGAVTAVLGSVLVSLDTDELMKLLGLPPSFAGFLSYRFRRVPVDMARQGARRYADLQAGGVSRAASKW